MLPALCLMLTAAPAAAWEFTPTPVCTLRHATASVAIEITHDPAAPEPYAIVLRRAAGWPATDRFAIRFEGPQPRMIVTDRHRLSEGATRLAVTDHGFDNLLDGLQFNDSARAEAGSTAEAFGLQDAAAPVRRFRSCTTALPLS